jgi:hypothetical protein
VLVGGADLVTDYRTPTPSQPNDIRNSSRSRHSSASEDKLAFKKIEAIDSKYYSDHARDQESSALNCKTHDLIPILPNTGQSCRCRLIKRQRRFLLIELQSGFGPSVVDRVGPEPPSYDGRLIRRRDPKYTIA